MFKLDYLHRVGDRTFKVQRGAVYIYRELTAQEAADLGCEGANSVIVGRTGHIVGTAAPVTGREVKIPAGFGLKGVLSTFTYEDGKVLKGHVSS